MQNIRVKEHHRRNNSHPPQEYYEDMISSDVFFWGEDIDFRAEKLPPWSWRTKTTFRAQMRRSTWTQGGGIYFLVARWISPSSKPISSFVWKARKQRWDGCLLEDGMGWDGWVSKTVRCVCVLQGPGQCKSILNFPQESGKLKLNGCEKKHQLELVHGSWPTVEKVEAFHDKTHQKYGSFWMIFDFRFIHLYI